MPDAPLDRHLLHALPWLAAIVALAAAHVSVVERLDTRALPPAAPIVGIDVDIDIAASPPAPATHPLSLLPDVSTVRVVPAIENGRPVGLKLFGLRSDSTLGRLGLRNGDMIVRVDGQPVHAGAPTVAPYRPLRPRRVTVDLVRRGEPLSLTYAID